MLPIMTASGTTPVAIDDLKTGWTRPRLPGLSRLPASRHARRTAKSPPEDMVLLDAAVPDVTLFGAMLPHPILVNRPIFCSREGVRLSRPGETVRDELEGVPSGPLFEEDRARIIDAEGRRVG